MTEDEIRLVEKSDGLYLEADGLSMHGDYTKYIKRLRPARVHEEMIVKAAKIKDFKGAERILDATAGLGEDSLMLSGAGFHVTLCERDEVIYRLLSDTVERARKVPELEEIVARMSVNNVDSVELMKKSAGEYDVIILDPMFPEREKTGMIKKKFQLLQRLESPCEEEALLLNAAIGAGPKRIVIKRPLKGPYLAGKKPSYSIDGKAIRYDIIIL